jgi:hypothetical protein
MGKPEERFIGCSFYGKTLENALKKIDLGSFSNDEFIREYEHFFVKSKIVENNDLTAKDFSFRLASKLNKNDKYENTLLVAVPTFLLLKILLLFFFNKILI